MSNPVELSFVIPLYNEEEIFDVLVHRLQSTMATAGRALVMEFVEINASQRPAK